MTTTLRRALDHTSAPAACATLRRRPALRRAGSLAGGLVLAAGLVACSGPDDTAEDPAPETSESTPTESPSTAQPSDSTQTPAPDSGSSREIPASGSAGVTEALLVSATGAGGSSSTLAFALDGQQAIADYTGEFDAGLAGAVAEAVDEVTTRGTTAYGSTVAVGCDAPTGVRIDAGEAGFEVTPEMPGSGVQCVEPITFVAVFAAPNA